MFTLKNMSRERGRDSRFELNIFKIGSPGNTFLFLHFLEDTRAPCITTLGYEYVESAPPVVVVRHRKTLDSAAHEYAKRIAVRGLK